MILVGQYDSPFVRRVAITLHHYGLDYDRRALSTFGDFEDVLTVNPLGKIPALELADGEVLVDSQAILDHLDEVAGADAALTPPAGAERRAVLRRCAVALGVAEKAIALRTELYRRTDRRPDAGLVDRMMTQVASGLRWLEAQKPGPWFAGERMMQDDVTAAVVVTFLKKKPPEHFDAAAYPALDALNTRAEALPPFQAVPFVEG
jgi:glutathione S-transferase